MLFEKCQKEIDSIDSVLGCEAIEVEGRDTGQTKVLKLTVHQRNTTFNVAFIARLTGEKEQKRRRSIIN